MKVAPLVPPGHGGNPAQLALMVPVAPLGAPPSKPRRRRAKRAAPDRAEPFWRRDDDAPLSAADARAARAILRLPQVEADAGRHDVARYALPIIAPANDDLRELIADCLETDPGPTDSAGDMLRAVRDRVADLEDRVEKATTRADALAAIDHLDMPAVAREAWHHFSTVAGRDPRAWIDLAWEDRAALADGVRAAFAEHVERAEGSS